MSEFKQLLEKLDFNGVHCGDSIAAAYFREAAIALRMLERDRNHYQQAAAIERQKAFDASRSVRQLSAMLEDMRGRAEAAAKSTTDLLPMTPDIEARLA